VERLEQRRLLATFGIDLSFGEAGVAFTPNLWGDAYLVHQLSNGKILLAAKANHDNPIVSFPVQLARS